MGPDGRHRSVINKILGGDKELAALKQCSPNKWIQCCGSVAPKAGVLEGGSAIKGLCKDSVELNGY